jgi:hypothetical protein
VRRLSINETWTNVAGDPCLLYKCSINGRIERSSRACNTSCAGNLIYTPVRGECCGRCESAVCVDENSQRGFREGEVWKNADNCTINECLRKGNKLVVGSYKKSCPRLRNCPVDNIEMRDCCQFCNRLESEFGFIF